MEKLLLSLLEVKHHFDLVQAKVSGHAVCPSMHNFDQIEAGAFYSTFMYNISNRP